MASKQNYHYLFREGEGTALAIQYKYNFECNKTEDDGDGLPVQTYHLWGNQDDYSDLLCDCPASYHHANRGQCKHVKWLRRWLAIQQAREKELEEPSNRRRTDLTTPIY